MIVGRKIQVPAETRIDRKTVCDLCGLYTARDNANGTPRDDTVILERCYSYPDRVKRHALRCA